ncbi:MAG: LamG domain-containing protein [Phycisphaerales bacterium]|jgi:hypothetical protein
MVLIIVLAITIIATGFIARTDVELACGENMLMGVQMNHLAESALEHARVMLLEPQEATTSYWTGGSGIQLVWPSPDYYDVSVALDTSDATDYCRYNVACEAYRKRNGQKVGRYGLSAVVRLDPAIGLWTSVDTTLRPNWVLHGDMRTLGTIINQAATASLDGDVFATTLTGTCVGQKRAYADVSLTWPPVTGTYVKPPTASTNITTTTLTTNPGFTKIWRRAGDLALGGGVTVQGMLLVTGNLTVTGSGSRIAAGKNLPALYVGGDLVLEDANNLSIEGLTVVAGNLRLRSNASGIKFTGGLCLGGTISETITDASPSGNQAVVVGNPQWITGSVDKALNLSAADGVSDYVQTTDSSSLLQLSGDYTLSLWLKAAATQNNNAGVMIRCSPDGASTHWGLQFNATTPKLLVARHLADGGNPWSTGITLDEIAGVWHHVAVVRSGTAMTSYLDGVQRMSGAWTYASGTGDGHLNLGAQATVAATTLYAGAIDDVHVYDHAWTAAEIAQIKAGQSLSYLIGRWRLDGPGSSVTILADPIRASIASWPNGLANPVVYWSPAAGAFYRSIARQLP